MEAIYTYIFSLFQTVDYTAVFLMMLIEASMLPFPSEVPLLAIGIQSAKGAMNPFVGLGISLVAIFIGATVNYSIGYYIGDAFVEKYGKYFFIKKHAYHEAKRLYEKNENFYTFYGRLMPLVRQLMSLPAGMVRMPFWRFIGLTLAGSAIWHSILITLGYIIGENTAIIKQYITLFTLVFFIVGVTLFVVKNKKWLLKMLKKIQTTKRKGNSHR